MELTLVFGILPLALFSFLSRGKRADAGLGFLAALAPVIGSAVSSIFNRKGAQSAQQNEIDYRRQVAEQEAARKEGEFRATFEQQQNSPAAVMQRLGFNTRLSHLLGGFGGRAQTPGFIQEAFDSARTPQEYQPGFQSEFIEPPKRGGSFWDYAGDALGAASYFDTQRYGKDDAGAPGAPAGATAAPAGGGAPTALLPSSFRRKNFNLGPTPAADEFLQQRR